MNLKKLILILLIINRSTKTIAMEQCSEQNYYDKLITNETNSLNLSTSINNLPNEIILIILEANIIDIIKEVIKNSDKDISIKHIYTAILNIEKFLKKTKLVNKIFYNLSTTCLNNFIRKNIAKYFAKDYIDLNVKDKEETLKNIITTVPFEETELWAAKLIITGTNPNLTVDEYNKTPLIFNLSKSNFPNLNKLIIRYKADINIKNESGWTPLMFAVYNNQKNIVKKLIKHKNLDINAQNVLGNTALIIACRKNYENIINLLLSHKKIAINIKNHEGHEAIMWAVYNKNNKIVKRLLKHKNSNVKNLNIIRSMLKSLIKLNSLIKA